MIQLKSCVNAAPEAMCAGYNDGVLAAANLAGADHALQLRGRHGGHGIQAAHQRQSLPQRCEPDQNLRYENYDLR